MTDDWKNSIERQLQQLHGDVRALLFGLIGAGVFLLTAIGGLYLYVNSEVGALEKRVGALEVQQARIEGKIDLLLERSGRRTKTDAGLRPFDDPI